MIRVNGTIVIPAEELEWSYARSGGPGGQNVNKVASKAVLRWAMAASAAIPPPAKDRIRAARPSLVTTEGDLIVTSQRYRDQERNRADCADKLAAVVKASLEMPKPRRPSKPTKGSRQRRLAEKKQNSERKAARRAPGREE